MFCVIWICCSFTLRNHYVLLDYMVNPQRGPHGHNFIQVMDSWYFEANIHGLAIRAKRMNKCKNEKKNKKVMLTRNTEMRKYHHTFLEDINIWWHFFYYQAFCLNNLFYCFSFLLFVISKNENLLLHKLDFYIFRNLTRCKTQYLKIGLRYWFEFFRSHLQG